MKRKREIKTSDLNKALRRNFSDAKRENLALGLETLYEKEGYIVSLDSSGREHKVKKLEKKKRKSSPRVIAFD